MSAEFWKRMNEILHIEVRNIPKNFSKGEIKLLDWLKSADDEVVFSLLEILEGQWLTRYLPTDKWFREVYDKQECLGSLDKEVAAILLIYELRAFSGNTLNVFSEQPHYEEILTSVHKRIAKRNNLKVPDVATVSYRENNIALILMQEALKSLSPEEIEGALRGANIQPTKEMSKKILLETASTAGFAGVSRLVGKKVLKELVLKIIENYLMKQFGKKAAKVILKKVATKVPQKIFKTALGWFGVAMAVKDVYDIAGEASRVTVPFVIHISIYRTMDKQKLESSDDESVA